MRRLFVGAIEAPAPSKERVDRARKNLVRLLAADLSRDLEATPDAILRALSNRERGRT